MIDIKILASGSSGNCYLVSDGTTNILLDAGIPWREIQRRSGWKKIDAAFVTHEHQDHAKAVKDMVRFGVMVVMPIEMSMKPEDYERTYPFAFGVCSETKYPLKGMTFLPFELQHDVPCLGYCIDIGGSRIVYITDTMYCKYTFPGVTHWIIEINYVKEVIDANVENGTVHQTLRNRVVQTHTSLDTAIQMLKMNDLSKTQEILIVHLSNDNSDAELIKNAVEAATGKLVTLA